MNYPLEASGKRKIADPRLFDVQDEKEWENVYEEIMDEKYKKNTRNFSKKIVGKKTHKPKIYLIPRQRGGSSYKQIKLQDGQAENLQFCPISKGFSMQDVSSFTIGPVVGEGLCLVNSAFSKIICVGHIEGGGKVDIKRKNFWKRAKKPKKEIDIIDENNISVDGFIFNTIDWLKNNENLWLDEWDKWSKTVALCSKGDFHWNNSEIIGYRHKNNYLDFVRWKKECYIKPSYDLLPKTDVYKFLEKLLAVDKVSIGLVHPMAMTNTEIKPITKEYIQDLFDSACEMCCQPYVVAGKLLNVKVD